MAIVVVLAALMVLKQHRSAPHASGIMARGKLGAQLLVHWALGLRAARRDAVEPLGCRCVCMMHGADTIVGAGVAVWRRCTDRAPRVVRGLWAYVRESGGHKGHVRKGAE